jgi:general secretion pathway protein C
MKQIFNPKLLAWLITLIGVVLGVKLLWLAVEWIVPLPLQGMNHAENSLRHTLHYRYRLASDAQLKAPTHTQPKPVVAPQGSLSDYKLVGIYSDASHAVVTLVRGNKSFILSNDPKGGVVEGYRLKDANTTTARFQKAKKILTLKLFEKKLPATATAKGIRAVSKAPAVETRPEVQPKAPIYNDGDTRVIQRSLIQEYTENPDKIWKNIGLYEVKSNGKLDGFKVRFVRRGSPFEKLGLKRGDIIKSINGEPIVDYATPMRMLRSADSIDDLSLTIERNHEEQELKYEVK